MDRIIIFFDIHREYCAIALKDSKLELVFNVTHGATGHARYAVDDCIRLVFLGPISSIKKYKLTSSSWKEIEENKFLILFFFDFVFKLILSSDDLSLGFHRNNTTREKELTNKRENKRKISCEKFFSRPFRSCRAPKNAIYDKRFNLPLQNNSDNLVIRHENGSNAENLALEARDIRFDTSCFVPRYNPDISQEKNVGAYTIWSCNAINIH